MLTMKINTEQPVVVEAPDGARYRVELDYDAPLLAVTVPIGVAAAISTQNRFPGRGLVRSIYLIPYVLPAFVVGTFFVCYILDVLAFDDAERRDTEEGED